MRDENPGLSSESIETIFGVKRLTLMQIRIRDPKSGIRKLGSGIWVKHLGSATLCVGRTISFSCD
jgi:hypothetical protein